MKQNKVSNTLKREFLQAVLSGDKERTRNLRNKIRFTEEMPFFIEYQVKDGFYYLDWKDLKLTEKQFEQLKQDCPQLVYWEEVKTYPEEPETAVASDAD